MSEKNAEGDSFLSSVEKDLGVKIPVFLKNILIINGLSNSVSIKSLSESDIDNLEKFVREDLKDLIEDHLYEEYFGPLFKKKPEKFKFLVGHRNLLKELIKYFNSPHTIIMAQAKRSAKKPNPQNISVGPSIEGDNLDPNENHQVAQNLTIENQVLGKLINKNVKDLVKKYNVSKDYLTRITAGMQNTEYCCYIQNANVFCSVGCFICSTKIKIKKNRKGDKYYWSLSNYYSHFSKHLETVPSESTSSHFHLHFPPNRPKLNQKSLLSYYDKNVTHSNLAQTISDDLGDDSAASESQPCTSTAIYDANKEITRKKRPRIIISDSESDSNLFQSEKENFFNDGPNLLEATRPVILSSTPHSNQSSLKSTKWSSIKYSRSGRAKRKRENIETPSSQTIMTQFYKPVDKIKNLLIDDATLNEMFWKEANLLNSHPRSQTATIPEKQKISKEKLPNFISRLIDTAVENSKKKSKNANKFDVDLKHFCAYLFVIGGRLTYETIYANMEHSIPSISSVMRTMDNISDTIEEGVLRFKELSLFLEKRQLQKKVWISEDATRITGKIEYNPSNNKIIGFVAPLGVHGLPIKDTFLANDAAQIINYFRSYNRADYAYVIMAQPPDNRCPSFCLGLFGTDNRFTYESVQSRWNAMKEEALKCNIQILGYSSDGDTRLLKCMRLLNMKDKTNGLWNWYQMNLNENVICVQDHVHIGTKLRTRLLNDKICLVMGKYNAASSYLKQLIEKVPKDMHLLTHSDIEPQDKMNFRAVEKISTEEVSNLLNKQVPESMGTCIYLKVIRYVLKAYLDKTISVTERIHLLWYSVFFLRMWREWLKLQRNLSTTKNFISLNAYLCIELNAHALIKLVRKYRDDETLHTEQFTPWLFSSQPCEQMFRATRSLTSTFSTVVNFSLQSIINRIRKIEFISNTVNDLSEQFIFPRERTSRLEERECTPSNITFLTDEEIEKSCLNALSEAQGDCRALGINYEDSWVNMSIASSDVGEITTTQSDEGTLHNSKLRPDEEEEEEDSPIIITNSTSFTENKITKIAMERLQNLDLEQKNDNGDDAQPADIPQELLEIGSEITYTEDRAEDSHFEDLPRLTNHFVNKLDPKSPFVRVKAKDKTITVRKSSLCWLLDNKTHRLSSDRLLRVRSYTTHPNKTSIIVEAEKYYAAYYADNWYIGRALEVGQKEIKMKFLKSVLNDFVWPKPNDIDAVDVEQVFFGPITLKGSYPFTIEENDRARIVTAYKRLRRENNVNS